MKSITILLIGAIVAVAFAAPSSKVSMQDDNDNEVARTARWLNIARHVARGLDSALNGGDDEGKLLSQALLDRIQEKVSMQDDDDDDDDNVAKAARLGRLLSGVARGIGHLFGGGDDDRIQEQVSMQDDDDDDEAKAQIFGLIRNLFGGEKKLALNQDDDDDEAKAQIFGLIKKAVGSLFG